MKEYLKENEMLVNQVAKKVLKNPDPSLLYCLSKGLRAAEETGDKYFDLKGLSAYSALGVGTLRDHIRRGNLPYFKVKGKILVKRSEFDQWIENYRVNKKQDLDKIVDDVLESLKNRK
jgi:excisionase family DNA binding protein